MIYSFSQYVLDSSRCELRFKGSVVALEAQVYAVLAALVENGDRIVSKEDLVALVWCGRIISDSAIASRIHAARAAIGDDGQRQAFIKTFSGRGYRFIAQLTRGEAPSYGLRKAGLSVDGSQPALRRQRRPAIVVMPFNVMSDESDDFHVAAGLAEEVSMRIALWSTFPVIARQSAIALSSRALSTAETGQHLGAQYLVEGSFRRSRSHVRVNVRLIGADTGHQLWAQHCETRTTDIFKLQEEIADTIAGALEPS